MSEPTQEQLEKAHGLCRGHRSLLPCSRCLEISDALAAERAASERAAFHAAAIQLAQTVAGIDELGRTTWCTLGREIMLKLASDYRERGGADARSYEAGKADGLREAAKRVRDGLKYSGTRATDIASAIADRLEDDAHDLSVLADLARRHGLAMSEAGAVRR